MDDLVKFKNDFFDVAIKDIIDNIELSNDKKIDKIYGWIYKPVEQFCYETSPFKFLIENITIIKDGKRYVAIEDTGILFNDFSYYIFWKEEDNLNLKDGIYYKNYLVSDKLISEETKTSKINVKKMLEDYYKEFGCDKE